MLFKQHWQNKNALLFRAFLFSRLILAIAIVFIPHQLSAREMRNVIDMSNVTMKTLVKTVQLQIASNAGLHADNLHVVSYRAYPDMSLVEDINRRYQSGEPMPDYAPDSFLGFIFSKPAIENQRVIIHALEVLDKNGNPANQVWLKLKSGKAWLKNNDIGSDVTTDVIDIRQLQQSVFEQLNISTKSFDASAVRIGQGPVWLDTPIDKKMHDGRIVITLPIVETPLDAPERFAGHFYIKLLTALD